MDQRRRNEHDYDSKELTDLRSACDLLGGFTIRDQQGLPFKKYFDECEQSEFDAREAIARLLRNNKPLSSHLRQMLAALFDPQNDTYSTFDGCPIERIIVFKQRRPGSPRQDLRDLAIGSWISEENKKRRLKGSGRVQLKAIFADAQGKFRLGRVDKPIDARIAN
jgi:hypothetical protein